MLTGRQRKDISWLRREIQSNQHWNERARIKAMRIYRMLEDIAEDYSHGDEEWPMTAEEIAEERSGNSPEINSLHDLASSIGRGIVMDQIKDPQLGLQRSAKEG